MRFAEIADRIPGGGIGGPRIGVAFALAGASGSLLAVGSIAGESALGAPGSRFAFIDRLCRLFAGDFSARHGALHARFMEDE